MAVTVPRTIGRWRRWVAALPSGALVLVLTGCVLPADRETADTLDPDSPCAVCGVTFDVCRKRDDYDPCLAMRRYCVNWCAAAGTCEEACDGARWGCDAVVDLRRSTCDKTEAACASYCEAAGAPADAPP